MKLVGSYLVPNGIEELIETYGPLPVSKEERAAWEIKHLVTIQLPFTMRVSFKPTQSTYKIRVHKAVQDQFASAFSAIDASYYVPIIAEYGGTHTWRVKRTRASEMSTHAWGISIDLNPRSNVVGTVGCWPNEFIELMNHYGFVWGGDFNGLKDPMHFQLVAGY